MEWMIQGLLMQCNKVCYKFPNVRKKIITLLKWEYNEKIIITLDGL